MKIRIKIQGSLIFLALIAAFFLHDFLVPQWKSRLAEELLDMLGAAVFLLGFLIRITARGYKEDHTFSGHTLVKDGLYSIIRNPMYFGTFLIGASAIIMLFNLWAFILFSAIFLLIYLPQIKNEEDVLSARFGQQYQAYRESTPGLFPAIRNLTQLGKHIALKPFWVKKELSSFTASFIAIAAIEIWEDMAIFGRRELYRESAGFVLIAAAMAVFVIYKVAKSQ